MIPVQAIQSRADTSIPRESGDDPNATAAVYAKATYSPRERG